MISDLIVGLTVLFALGWLLASWFVPSLRRKIEQPKFAFQDQLKHFDTLNQVGATSGKETPHDPR
jgi:hypothetical protein